MAAWAHLWLWAAVGGLLTAVGRLVAEHGL